MKEINMNTIQDIRDALDSYKHMIKNGHTKSAAIDTAFGHIDLPAAIEMLLNSASFDLQNNYKQTPLDKFLTEKSQETWEEAFLDVSQKQ